MVHCKSVKVPVREDWGDGQSSSGGGGGLVR